MKKFILSLVLILGIGISGIFITSVAYAHEESVSFQDWKEPVYNEGWNRDEYHNWYYYKNGQFLKKQWLYENDKWYYFKENRVMASKESQKVGDKVYLFSDDGSMYTGYGWTKLASLLGDEYTWYYVNGDGSIKNEEWFYDNNKWYYFNSSGRMVSNKAEKIGDKVYLFSNDGSMYIKYGWISMINTLYSKNYWYYGNGDGSVKISQWLYENGKWYYFKGINEEEPVYGHVYGIMASGTEEIDGKTYLFNSDGTMDNKIGWIKYGYDDFVYGNGDGTVKSGEWLYENGKWYYFTHKKVGYDNENGENHFCFYFAGQMFKNVSEYIDGKSYTFDHNGVCINP